MERFNIYRHCQCAVGSLSSLAFRREEQNQVQGLRSWLDTMTKNQGYDGARQETADSLALSPPAESHLLSWF